MDCEERNAKTPRIVPIWTGNLRILPQRHLKDKDEGASEAGMLVGTSEV